MKKNAILIFVSCTYFALLVGCGGGGGGSNGNAAQTGSKSGILTDAAVAGVAYTTSSGVTGVTDANGAYKFNPGDTVQFKLGGLVLGSATATGIVSPIELANGDNNRLQNLLVMLQSLDANGIPADGISIPPAAAAAVTTAIDLTAAPATFASAANTALQAAMTAGGIMTPIVSTIDANAHFLAQGTALFASNIWTQPLTSDGTTAMLRFNAGGEYLIGETGPPDAAGQPGVEHGTASVNSFDVFGYATTAVTTVDTSGEWGLSHPQLCDRSRPVGDQIVFTESVPPNSPVCTTTIAEATVSKAENNPTGIVGVWANGSATVIKTQHIVFFSDGHFLLVDPLGDTTVGPGHPCGGPGVEAGSYTYDSAANVLTTNNLTVDTNGCAGLSDNFAAAALSFTISADGSTAAVDDGSVTLYRVSK